MQLVRSRAARFAAPCFLLVALIISSCASSPEAKSASYIETGKKMLKNSDTARAILQFQNAVKAAPRNPEAYYQLATAFMVAGNLNSAGIALRKALELNPKHPGAELLLAKLMALSGEKETLENGEKRLQDALAGSPDDPTALHALALTELKLGNAEEAVRNLNRAMVLAPQSTLIAMTLSEAKLRQNDPQGAEKVLKDSIQNSPKSVAAVVMLGRFYLREKRASEAEQEFRRALTIDANDSTALYSLGMIQYDTGKNGDAEQTFQKLSRLPDKTTNASLAEFLFQEGRKEEALTELGRLWKQDPSDRLARTRVLAAYLALNRPNDAEKVLNEALKKNAKDLEALLQRSEIEISTKRLNEAEADLNQVLHLQPISSTAHYLLAQLCLARNEDLRYRQELTRTLELDAFQLPVRLELAGALIASKNGGKPALDLLDLTPESQRDLPAVWAKRNWALWAIGDMPAMRKGIDRGLSLGRSTEFLLQDGLWKLKSGNASGARASLEEALKLNPSDVRALSALKQSLDMQKQTALAVEKVKEYAAREPKSAAVQDFLGSVLMARGDRAGARSAFQAAKTADPHSTPADLSLVQMDVMEGKIDDAQRRVQSVVAADPSNSTAQVWLGELEYMKGDYKTSLQQFRTIVASEPNNAQALNNLAFLLAEYGNQPAEALKYAQKAKEIAPDAKQYSDTLGWVLYRQGLYPLAVKELERATASRSEASWDYHLAMAYAKAGDLNRGRATLQAALKRNPGLPVAKIAQQVVDEAGKGVESKE